MIKNTSDSGIKNENMSEQQLAEELHEPIITKILKRKVYLSFTDNIWGPDLADLKLIGKFNKGTPFLFCVVDIFSKYIWVIPLKDKTYYNY